MARQRSTGSRTRKGTRKLGLDGRPTGLLRKTFRDPPLRSLCPGALSPPRRASQGRGADETPQRCSNTLGPGPRGYSLIEESVQRRARRGLALWRTRGAEFRPMPSGGLSVPSCSEPGRTYRVSLAGEGRCGCADWRRRREPCKHVFAALVWAAKWRVALRRAERSAA